MPLSTGHFSGIGVVCCFLTAAPASPEGYCVDASGAEWGVKVMLGRKNVFVVGLDEHNRRVLESMQDAHLYTFHGVPTYEEIYGGPISFHDPLTSAQGILDSFDRPIDTILGFWDFPVSAMVPLLRQGYGLPAVSKTEWIVKFQRAEWQVSTVTRTVLTSTATDFHLRAELDAYEGGQSVASCNWDHTVPRDNG